MIVDEMVIYGSQYFHFHDAALVGRHNDHLKQVTDENKSDLK